MKRAMGFLLTLLLLVSLAAPTAAAETGVYRVLVRDEQGLPVSDVMLKFCSDSTCTLVATDADGAAAFETEAGGYTVQVLKAPEAYLADETAYPLPEDFGELTITLRSAEEALVYELPYSGFAFAAPESFRDSVGQIVVDDVGEIAFGSGVYYGYLAYLGRSEEEAAEISAMLKRAQGRELTAEETARLEEYYYNTIFAELLVVVAIDGGRGLDDILAFFRVDEEHLFAAECGQAGDCRFFLLMFDPELALAAFPEDMPARFAEEYRALASPGPEAYVSCISVKEPLSRHETARVGTDVTFSTSTLDGTAVTSEEIFGGHKVTMINLWATWCGPCKAELPALEKLSVEFEAQGCQIIGLCIDADNDSTAVEAVGLLEKNGASYPNYRTFDGLSELLPFSAVPTSYFVDSEGRILTAPVIGADPAGYSARLAEALALVGS